MYSDFHEKTNVEYITMTLYLLLAQINKSIIFPLNTELVGLFVLVGKAYCITY